MMKKSDIAEQGSHGDGPSTQSTVARRLRLLRATHGWSLDRTAAEIGVSKAMLGQIERGESSPTVATLWKIADGFGCSVSSFLVEPAEAVDTATVFVNAGSVREQPAVDNMLMAPLFSYDPRFGFELFELTLLPGYTRISEAHVPGVTEHVIVLRGEMELFVDGIWKQLVEGDAIRFAADQPHGYRNLGSTPAVFHDLIHYPGETGS